MTQLRWRLHEGRSIGASGQAIYELGVRDDGALVGLGEADLNESLETIERMAAALRAHVSVVRKIEIDPAAPLRPRAQPLPGRRSRRSRREAMTVTPRTASSDLSPATPPDVVPSYREQIRQADDPIDLLDATFDPALAAFPACTDVFRWVSPTLLDGPKRAEADALALAKQLSSETKWEKKMAKRAERDLRRALGAVASAPVAIVAARPPSPMPPRPGKAAAKLRPVEASAPRFVVEVVVSGEELVDVGDLSSDFDFPLLL